MKKDIKVSPGDKNTGDKDEKSSNNPAMDIIRRQAERTSFLNPPPLKTAQ